jgi:hypothetical protein
MIFYQQVTEGQLIKKEPIHEESLRARSGIAAGRLRNPALPNARRKNKTRGHPGPRACLKIS